MGREGKERQAKRRVTISDDDEINLSGAGRGGRETRSSHEMR